MSLLSLLVLLLLLLLLVVVVVVVAVAAVISDDANGDTVSFHNFKSQNFKLRVSNPKSKYVAYLSVRSRTSNCQSPGRKSKFDFLKTDRIITITITVTIMSINITA